MAIDLNLLYIFQKKLYYIVSTGTFTNHFISHIRETITEKDFDVEIKNVTNQIGIISIQGFNRFEIQNRNPNKYNNVNCLSLFLSVVKLLKS